MGTKQHERLETEAPRITWVQDERRNLNSYLALLGRILFGGFFAYSGLNHFLNLGGMAGFAASKGLPMPEVMVALSGLLLLAGGFSILLGFKPRVGAWLLVLFLVPTALVMHNFWAVPEAQAANEMTHFMKNIALAGAAMMISVIPRWPLSLDARG